MKKRTVLHVVAVVGGWRVEELKPKRNKPHGVYLRRFGETKDDAIYQAKAFARGHLPSQIVVHGRDGRIQREFTYGLDPVRSKG